MKTDPKPATRDARLAALVAHWIRPEIRDLEAYEVPDATGLIKLDAMENPYPWPEDMVRAWLEHLRGVELNRYPDAAAVELKARLREFMEVPPEMDLMLGNGSDELIQIVQMAMAGRRVLVPSPTFVMYRMIATSFGGECVTVPLGPDFGMDLPAMLEAIEYHRPAVIFLAYPNNPTGNLFDKEAVERVVRATEGLVVLDEAYHAFSGTSFMPRLGEFDNLLVMRTLSKLGLAGLRLGVLVGPRAWLDEFDKVRLPYNINVLTQASAEFALRRRVLLDKQVADIRSDRERLTRDLARLPGVEVFPSHTNFILFRLTVADAETVYAALWRGGVLVKNLHRPDTPLAGCLRVTVGRPEENQVFLQVLEKTL